MQEQDTSSLSSESTSLSDHTETTSLFQDEDWDQEAVKLYDWSRTLRPEDIGEGL